MFLDQGEECSKKHGWLGIIAYVVNGGWKTDRQMQCPGFLTTWAKRSQTDRFILEINSAAWFSLHFSRLKVLVGSSNEGVLCRNTRSYSTLGLLVLRSKAAVEGALESIHGEKSPHHHIQKSFLVRRKSATMNYAWLNWMGIK